MQMIRFFRYFIASNQTAHDVLTPNREKIFEPFTYIQPGLRFDFANVFFDGYLTGPTKTEPPLLAAAVRELEEGVAREPHYPQHHLSLGKGYDLLADFHPSEAQVFRKKAEEQYLAGLAIFPGNPRITYAYAVNLAGQKRQDEAIAMLRTLYASDPRVAESAYYLGLILYTSAPQNAAESLGYFEQALDGKQNPLPNLTLSIYRQMLPYYYNQGDLAHFTTVVQRLAQLPSEDKATYASIATYIEEHHALPTIAFNPE
jgi:tetratricopeptide (TPR) repeat protein